MSDYELIMLILEVITVVIAWKKQIALRYRLVAR